MVGGCGAFAIQRLPAACRQRGLLQLWRKQMVRNQFSFSWWFEIFYNCMLIMSNDDNLVGGFNSLFSNFQPFHFGMIIELTSMVLGNIAHQPAIVMFLGGEIPHDFFVVTAASYRWIRRPWFTSINREVWMGFHRAVQAVFGYHHFRLHIDRTASTTPTVISLKDWKRFTTGWLWSIDGEWSMVFFQMFYDGSWLSVMVGAW